MVTEFLLDIVFDIVTGLFTLAPEITWTVDTTAFTYVRDILSVVGYLLPMDTIFAIVVMIVSITVFKVVIALITTLWDLLPIV